MPNRVLCSFVGSVYSSNYEVTCTGNKCVNVCGCVNILAILQTPFVNLLLKNRKQVGKLAKLLFYFVFSRQTEY